MAGNIRTFPKLVAAKGLTESLGGTIHVESSSDAGTIFQVSVPVDIATDGQIPLWKGGFLHHESITETIQPLHSVCTNKPLILIVEDNKELLAFIAGALQAQYRILTAENGAEGLIKAQEDLPDIIISDIMMPEMNGYDLCRLIKNDLKTSHIAFIILTAKTSHDSVMEGLMYSSDDYIKKPFHTDELGFRIRNILGH